MGDPSEKPDRPPARAPARPKVYLESRYRKLERGLPQTIFYCPTCKGDRRKAKSCKRCEGFGKLTKDSVQELIARHILPAFKARYGKFHGAGREDIDVLMLGRGRPFVYEVVGPRQFDVDLDALRQQILERHAGRIDLDPLVPVERKRVVYWKEARFDKVYCLRVRPVGSLKPGAAQEQVGKNLDIVQRTPTRVAFRRADLERERQVEVLAVEVLDGGLLELQVKCAHGTYVKEWVSGDGGRTKPSLGDLLGVPCGCEQLDVLEILTD